MSQENSSILRFSLEESVWFQKGQEVEELLSISLDPNITIQENDQYITIKGSLELSGEYKPHNDGEVIEEGFKAPKLVHSIMEREEGVCEFLHHFPVDITIPITRVSSLDDLEVEIETFDYVFPERSCLNLTADLSIVGLADETSQANSDWTEEEEEEELELAYRDAPQSHSSITEEAYELSFREEAESIEEEEPVEIEITPFQSISQPSIDVDNEEVEGDEVDFHTPFEVEVRKAPDDPEDDWDQVSSADISYFADGVPEELPAYRNEQELDVSFRKRAEDNYSAEEVFKKPQHESSSDSSDSKEELFAENEAELEESSSSPEDKGKKKKGFFHKKKSLTFTEFFARKEEETHTKVKVCIVQHGDTLEKLSDRYNVNIHSILKENRLELNQDVYEGQVLYIPGSFVEK